MSKERELLQALKDSVESDPYGASETTKETAQQVSEAASSSASSMPDLDLASAMDFFNAMGSSMIDDPLFYIKLLGVIILGVIIIMVAFELIIGS